MELYTKTAYELSERLTNNFSTSFSISSRLFSKEVQKHIYAIYGMVRIADEIVDTYQGDDQRQLLDEFEQEVLTQLTQQAPYSTNPIIHAFALTAQQFGINASLVRPFFESMRVDIDKKTFNQKEYETYIYGSAEVIGLMCLKVFCTNDSAAYAELESGAKALGSAYQKVNFLRDIAADYAERGRWYFPNSTFETFTEKNKREIEKDIQRDFDEAAKAIEGLPLSARKAVRTSFVYYSKLFEILKTTPAKTLKTKRVRLPNARKFLLLAKELVRPS